MSYRAVIKKVFDGVKWIPKATYVPLEQLIDDIHQTAKDKGWYDEPTSFGDKISLMHSELSEALEFERNKNAKQWNKGAIDYMHHYSGGGFVSSEPSEISKKPDGLLVELADVVIRVFDFVGSVDKAEEFIKCIYEKHEYNKTRPHKHGGKTL